MVLHLFSVYYLQTQIVLSRLSLCRSPFILRKNMDFDIWTQYPVLI
jgi:hypothetical protein